MTDSLVIPAHSSVIPAPAAGISSHPARPSVLGCGEIAAASAAMTMRNFFVGYCGSPGCGMPLLADGFGSGVTRKKLLTWSVRAQT